MILVVFLGWLMTAQLQADERYVLPQDIVEARDKVIESKRQLDRNILKRYRELCFKKTLNNAEFIELLAYQEITDVECYQIPFVKLR